MAKNKVLPYVLVGLPLAIGVYFLFKSFRQKEKESPQDKGEVGGGEQGQTKLTRPVSIPSNRLPLKKGSKGTLVTQVQQLMLRIDETLLPKFGADGDFGSETEAAVQKLLGKKTIDSQSDIEALNRLLNQKLFPFVAPPKTPINKLPLGSPIK